MHNRHRETPPEGPFQTRALGSWTRRPQSTPVMSLGPNPNTWWIYPCARTQDPSRESLFGQDTGDGKQQSSLPPERHQTLGSRAENPDRKNLTRTLEHTRPLRGHPRHTIQTGKPLLLPASHPRIKSHGAAPRVCRSGASSPRP